MRYFNIPLILIFVTLTLIGVSLFLKPVHAVELPIPSEVLTVNPTSFLVSPEPPKPPKPVEYTITSADSLTTIAKTHNTTVQRLYDKNVDIVDPDLIINGHKLVIPFPDEVLTTRPVPVKSAPIKVIRASYSFSRSGKSTPGWYYAGQCTRWVADHRYVPDGWGDASDWKWHAQAEGWTVSNVPVAGAIGWTSGHVVYVESVGDGVVTISEQNWDWNSSIRTVTVPISKYVYLYQ